MQSLDPLKLASAGGNNCHQCHIPLTLNVVFLLELLTTISVANCMNIVLLPLSCLLRLHFCIELQSERDIFQYNKYLPDALKVRLFFTEVSSYLCSPLSHTVEGRLGLRVNLIEHHIKNGSRCLLHYLVLFQPVRFQTMIPEAAANMSAMWANCSFFSSLSHRAMEIWSIHIVKTFLP